MAKPGMFLIQVEVKLTAAEHSNLEKNIGYSASAKRYGVPKSHWHRRLVATAGADTLYPGDYELVTWAHVAIQLRNTAAEMLKYGKIVAASSLLGFVAAVEQNFGAKQE
jgi:hypothetical protein